MTGPASIGVDLNDRMSFAMETISKDQAKARWKILAVDQTKLIKLDPPQDLTPRSQEEKKLLGKAIQEKNPPHSIRIVLDDEGLFYDIEMREKIIFTSSLNEYGSISSDLYEANSSLYEIARKLIEKPDILISLSQAIKEKFDTFSILDQVPELRYELHQFGKKANLELNAAIGQVLEKVSELQEGNLANFISLSMGDCSKRYLPPNPSEPARIGVINVIESSSGHRLAKGFANIGNSCYINAALQVLFLIPDVCTIIQNKARDCAEGQEKNFYTLLID